MKHKVFLAGMLASLLTFGLILAGCSKKGSPARDFAYGLSGDGQGIVITGYTGPGGAVVIPSTIEGMPVVEIGNEAFERNNKLTSITLPDSIKKIGMSSFRDCAELTEVIIPASITEIIFAAAPNDHHAFYNNNEAFRGCGKLPLKTRQAIAALQGGVDL